MEKGPGVSGGGGERNDRRIPEHVEDALHKVGRLHDGVTPVFPCLELSAFLGEIFFLPLPLSLLLSCISHGLSGKKKSSGMTFNQTFYNCFFNYLKKQTEEFN